MKVCKTDVNKISLHSIILQLQLTLGLSQFKEILSVYSDLLVLVANYSFIFENSSSEIQALKENPVSVETALITQDPIRDGINWYAYCNGDPINYIDENGLEATDKKKPAIYPTAGNAFNLDFGRDYSNMAVQNFKNGHPILGTIQMLDSACEIVYDLAAAYGCANVIGAFIATPTALLEKSESWLQSNGKPNYPPNNGAVLGTEVNQTLEVGTKIGRYGEIGPNSSFVTDTVSTASELSLPPWTDPSTYQEFTVIKPIVNVVGAEVEAWAGSTGGGMQYVLPQTIIQLQQEGYIK